MAENSKSTNNIFKSLLQFIKTIFNFLFKNKLGRIILIILLLAVASWQIYSAGERAGAKKQLAIDNKEISKLKNSSNPFGANRNSSLRRKNIIGNVINISEKEIEVKLKTGGNTKVKIDKDTSIYGTDRKKTNFKTIKKDQLVIITIDVEEDANTATRIRIQK